MKLALQRFKNLSIVKLIGFNRVVLILIIFLMYGLFTILTPILRNGSSFVNYNRILSAFNYAYFIGFLGLGVTFVIATGGIDFSIGPVMFCSALISGYCLTKFNMPLWLMPVLSASPWARCSGPSAGTLWRFGICRRSSHRWR